MIVSNNNTHSFNTYWVAARCVALGTPTGSGGHQDKHLLFTYSKAVLSRKPHGAGGGGQALFKTEPAIFIPSVAFPHILLCFRGAGDGTQGLVQEL